MMELGYMLVSIISFYIRVVSKMTIKVYLLLLLLLCIVYIKYLSNKPNYFKYILIIYNYCLNFT